MIKGGTKGSNPVSSTGESANSQCPEEDGVMTLRAEIGMPIIASVLSALWPEAATP
jgi:hypothetical protein